MTVPDGKTWAVTGQVPARKPGPGISFTDGVDVTYELADGSSYTLFVGAGDYAHPDTVRALIGADAAHRLAIANLSG